MDKSYGKGEDKIQRNYQDIPINLDVYSTQSSIKALSGNIPELKHLKHLEEMFASEIFSETNETHTNYVLEWCYANKYRSYAKEIYF